MQEHSRYGVGIDVGTSFVRCVIGHLEEGSSLPNIVGVGTAPNSGMRKGVVVNITHTAQAIDRALDEAERMSGHQVEAATVDINGSHITAISSKGVIAVGVQNQGITEEDIARVEEAATVVQLPANREILQVTPRGYQLDGQENIKDPIGMQGVRLEVDAHVITALTPHVKNLLKSLETTETRTNHLVVAVLGAARAVVAPSQMENGVAVIDIGSATTSIAVFEEGDLQHVAILPVGSVNITNDLAIGLRTDLDVAEQIKINHAAASGKHAEGSPKEIEIMNGQEKLIFSSHDVDMIVEARLEEIFELVDKELRRVDRSGKLPGGLVLTGGGANMNGISEYAKTKLALPARIAKPASMTGIVDKVTGPQFATAIGLMMIDLVQENSSSSSAKKGTQSKVAQSSTKLLGGLVQQASSILKKFKD